MDELDIILIVYLISFIKACNILEILPVQPRRAVDQPRGRGKDQAFQVEEHSLHIQHVSENKQTNKRKRMTKKTHLQHVSDLKQTNIDTTCSEWPSKCD